MALFRKAKEYNSSPKPDPQPVEIKRDSEKAEGSTALWVVAVIVFVASLFTLNVFIIVGAFFASLVLVIFAGSLQRAEDCKTLLYDIRDILNLQTARLDAISRAVQPGSSPETAQTLQKLCDIAEESRDILSTLHK